MRPNGSDPRPALSDNDLAAVRAIWWHLVSRFSRLRRTLPAEPDVILILEKKYHDQDDDMGPLGARSDAEKRVSGADLVQTMTARELVAALKGRWHGGYGTARCPAHDDNQPSLSVTASDGRILVKCHADCPQDAVIDALCRLGLWGAQAEGRETKRIDHEDRREVDDVKRSAAALAIWRAAVPIAGTLAERYLVTRGIEPPHPPSLRYHPGLRYHDQDGPGALILPALVAGIQWPDRRLGAIQSLG